MVSLTSLHDLTGIAYWQNYSRYISPQDKGSKESRQFNCLNAGCESTSCTVNMKISVQRSIDSIISAVITCNIAKTIVSFDTKRLIKILTKRCSL